MSTTAKKDLAAVWGFGPSDGWVGGYGGVIPRYDGSKWTAMSTGTNYTFITIWGTAPSMIRFRLPAASCSKICLYWARRQGWPLWL